MSLTFIFACLGYFEGTYYIYIAIVFARLFDHSSLYLFSAITSRQGIVGLFLVALSSLFIVSPQLTRRGLIPVSLAVLLYGVWTVVAEHEIVASITSALDGDVFAQEEVSGIGFIFMGFVGILAAIAAAMSSKKSTTVNISNNHKSD